MLWKVNRKKGQKKRIQRALIFKHGEFDLFWYSIQCTYAPQEERPFLSIFKCLRWLNFHQQCFTVHHQLKARHSCQMPNKSTKVENVQKVWLCWVWICCQHQPFYQSPWHMLTGHFQQVAVFIRTVPSSSLLLFLPSSSLHLPCHTCFRDCRLHDKVHLLRDFGSHLYFPLSLLFGVSVILMRVGERERELD